MCRRLIYLISFVLLLSVAITDATKAGLVGWWRLDEDSGNTAMDSPCNGFDIMLPDTTTWENGLFGGAVHFHVVGKGNVGNFRYRLQWSSNLLDILNP